MILFIIFESILPVFASEQFNHDKLPKIRFYGAYELINPSPKLDSIFKVNSAIKRIFIHKDLYFIIQTNRDECIDYKVIHDKLNHYSISEHGKQANIYFQKVPPYYCIRIETEQDTVQINALKIQL